MGPLLSRFWGAPILAIMPLNIIAVKRHDGYRHYGVLALTSFRRKVENLRLRSIDLRAGRCPGPPAFRLRRVKLARAVCHLSASALSCYTPIPLS